MTSYCYFILYSKVKSEYFTFSQKKKRQTNIIIIQIISCLKVVKNGFYIFVVGFPPFFFFCLC